MKFPEPERSKINLVTVSSAPTFEFLHEPTVQSISQFILVRPATYAYLFRATNCLDRLVSSPGLVEAFVSLASLRRPRIYFTLL